MHVLRRATLDLGSTRHNHGVWWVMRVGDRTAVQSLTLEPHWDASHGGSLGRPSDALTMGQQWLLAVGCPCIQHQRDTSYRQPEERRSTRLWPDVHSEQRLHLSGARKCRNMV